MDSIERVQVGIWIGQVTSGWISTILYRTIWAPVVSTYGTFDVELRDPYL
jgi:hypothetical protein